MTAERRLLVHRTGAGPLRTALRPARPTPPLEVSLAARASCVGSPLCGPVSDGILHTHSERHADMVRRCGTVVALLVLCHIICCRGERYGNDSDAMITGEYG